MAKVVTRNDVIQHCDAGGKSGVPWVLDCLGDSVTRGDAFVTLRDHLWIVLGGAALLLAPVYFLLNGILYKKRRQAAHEEEEAPDVQIFFRKDTR